MTPIIILPPARRDDDDDSVVRTVRSNLEVENWTQGEEEKEKERRSPLELMGLSKSLLSGTSRTRREVNQTAIFPHKKTSYLLLSEEKQAAAVFFSAKLENSQTCNHTQPETQRHNGRPTHQQETPNNSPSLFS